MKPAWILVADSSHARIFSAENSAADLIEIETLMHSQARMHEQKLDSDLPGKGRGSYGGGGHAYDDEISPKEQEEINFAKAVSSYLCDKLNQNLFDRLFIIAAPAFLGDLRHAFSNQVAKHVTFTLDKNVTDLAPKRIRGYLPLSLA
ncbi:MULTISPECIES: host attachment protein [Thiomicrorhabdus]|uniref:Host attachment protein n=1 Tax=Thiomicrorhabdus heinhorstiae TaxID=2748010 RepID=A0ABS0BT46_9GAMM|nr:MULTISPECIES: host attachment protein [Thiomicrorhabdus]MBF6056950.1 host attachment protein [Thiomicrorhabdus heinhorstiae]